MEAATARPDLRLVDTTTGEVSELPADVARLQAELEAARQQVGEAEAELRGKRSQITQLRNQLAEMQAVEPEAEQIMDVLEFWRVRCMPGASIVVGSERWQKTRARLRERDAGTKERCYTPLHLKAAVVGARLSEWHVKNKRLDAATLFRDSKTVDDHIGRAVTFKRAYGTSAVTLLDELGSPVFAWLSRRCACGHLWLEHLKGGPGPDGNQPCDTCRCPHFGESLDDQVERWKVEHAAEVPEAALMVAVHPGEVA